MKKRIWAAFLILVMVFSLLPTAVFAVDGENAGELTDENGITLRYEMVNTPRNGSYYEEGEQAEFQHSVINNGSESVTDVHVQVFSGGIIYPSLNPGEEQVKQLGVQVRPEDAMAGGIDDLLQCLYTLDGTEYKVSIPIHIKTGIAAPELTELNVVRTDGGLEASFESNCAGTYAYAVLGEGDAVPTDWSGYTRYEMTQGSNSFTISDAPARDAKLCVMAWNGKDEPLAQCAETAIPDYAYSLEEGFKALTETTQLPYNDQVNLGGEGSSLYAWEGKQVYGKLLRVELKEEDQLNLVFGDSGQALNTIIEVYRETSDGFSCVGSYWAGYGVSGRYLPEEAGTYYLAFLGYDKNQTGPCSLEASISPAPEVMPLEEGLRALTETTQLPYSAQVNLGGQGTVLYRQGEGFDSYYYYGTLRKVELEPWELLDLTFYGIDQEVDTFIEIYRQTSDGFSRVSLLDNDNVYDNGESGLYLAGEAGTYYLAFLVFDEDVTGRCTLEISSTKATDTDLENQIAIDASNFPDENFCRYVAEQLDINRDSFLSQLECNYVTTIDCSYQDIKDLTGIQFFQNLEFLYCTGNQLTELNLTGCPALRKLECSGNELTALDVTECPELEMLYCIGNQLTALDVTGCPALEVLYCTGNQLTALNVAGCPALEVLYCYSNQLTELNVTGCQKLEWLDCNDNQLTALDVTGCPELEGLYCQNNQLTALDVTGCPELGWLNCQYQTREVEIPRQADRSWSADLSQIVPNWQNASNVSVQNATYEDGSSRVVWRDLTARPVVTYDYATGNAVMEVTLSLVPLGITQNTGVESVTVQGQEAAIDGTQCTVELPCDASLPADAQDITIVPADPYALVTDLVTQDGGTTWTFTLTAGDEVTQATYTIQVSQADHALTLVEAKDPTCTEPGNIAYWTCEACHKRFSDEAGTKEITPADTMIETIDHTLSQIAAKDPTCTEPGNIRYWACRGCGKVFSDEAGTEEIIPADTVLEAVGHSYQNGVCTACGATDPDYEIFVPKIIQGANGTWKLGGKDGLSFTSDAAFADFQRVQVDGRDLDGIHYEVREGSTIVTLKASYLETLAVGKHTLAIVSATGTAATEFTIQAAQTGTTPQKTDSTAPKTGDDSRLLLGVGLLVAAGGALGALVYTRKRKQH